MSQSDSPTNNKTIVIVGGSYAGISTAHYLLKHALPSLESGPQHQILLVSTSSKAMCRPACPRALISDDFFPQHKLFVEIPEQFAQYPTDRFRFLHGTAVALDHIKRTITVKPAEEPETRTITYHALVIATGASTPSPLLGLNSDVARLRASWLSCRAALPTAKTIIIAGGGPAGIETAGELGEYLNGGMSWFGSRIKEPKVSITVITSGSKILPALRPTIAAKAENYLAQVGVTVIKNARVRGVEPADAGTDSVSSKATVLLNDGRALSTDLYIPATGTNPNTKFIDSALLTADGRVETNTSTLRADKAGPRVYAIGDVGSYAWSAIHLVLDAVPVLCSNIKRDLLLAAGKEEKSLAPDRDFKEDKRETQMVPIGKSKGVGAAMGYWVPSFFVWLIKGRDYWLWTTGGLWSGKQWAKES